MFHDNTVTISEILVENLHLSNFAQFTIFIMGKREIFDFFFL